MLTTRTPGIRLVLFLGLLVALGCATEDASTLDLSSDPDLSAEVTAAKADGAFGSREIELGERVSGSAGGDTLSLYAIELRAGDEFSVNVATTSGTLRPAAYLYFGTTVFIRPDSVESTSTGVALQFTAVTSGTHHIVVRAYRSLGEGSFVMDTACTGGGCAGESTLTGNARINECINAATDCAFEALPDYDGRVGPSTANRVFNGCLAETGPDCVEVCGSSDEASDACELIVAQLPTFADHSTACVAEMTMCLDSCREIDPFAGDDDIENRSSSACWSGYNGNCLEYVEGHELCGGDTYDAGSFDECRARCAATEGAFDEGPWDFCMEECDEIADGVDAYIQDVADDAGEGATLEDHSAFVVVDWDDVPRDVYDAADEWAANWTETAFGTLGRDDRADIYMEEYPLSIVRSGAIIGYMIDIRYQLEEPDFDGTAGAQLYFNTRAELVTEVEF